jgi:hypothetical protein
VQLIRCTQKLLKELKQEPTNVVPLNHFLGSWHANLLIVERHKCVLVTNDSTLYTIFIPCLKKVDFQAFNLIFGQHLFKNLLHEGFTQKQIEAVLNEHQEIKYAKTNNRSVLSSMNELASQLEFRIQINGGMKGTNIFELNHGLNRIIFRAINYKHPIEMLRIKLEE